MRFRTRREPDTAPSANPAHVPGGPPPQTPALSDSRRNATEAVTWPVRVAAAWGWRLLVAAAVVYVLVQILSRVGLVVFPVIIALFLTAVLQPLERQLRRVAPRPASLATLLAVLSGVIVLGAIGYFVAWQISAHTTQLGNEIADVVTHTRHWLQNGPLHVKSSDLDKLSSRITDTVRSHEGALISGAISTVRAVTEGLAALLLILLVTFFLLRDGPMVWGWVVRLFPRAAHARLDHAGRAGWRTFGGYMRGQLLIALVHGISITIVLFVLHIPLAAALGVLIFLGSFIPLVGLTITGALAAAVALLEHGLLSAIVVTAAIIVLVQAEGHVLQPLIMSRSVHVHPLAVVLAVVAGTTLGGIAGALIAVPLAAFVNTTVQAARAGPGEPGHEPKLPAGQQLPRGRPADGEP